MIGLNIYKAILIFNPPPPMNEPTVKKEELRKEFIELWEGRAIDPKKTWIDNIFDFFWKHLEASEKANFELAAHQCPHAIAGEYGDMVCKALHDKEELIKAADRVIMNASYENMGTVKFDELVNEYNKLKHSQSQSK